MIIFGLLQLILKGFNIYQRSMLSHMIILHAIIFGLCMYELYILYTRRNYKKLLSENKEYLEIQNRSRVTLFQKEQELKSFYHDFNIHVTCMKILSTRGNYDELNKYIETMSEVKHKINYGVYSGNPVIDEIIDEILADNESDIKVKFEGTLPPDINIKLFDLCVVFSNVLRNAVEACKKLKYNTIKLITIKISICNNTINIVVTNPLEEDIIIEDGQIVSTKKNKKYHGFGLYNVRKAVAKYDGDIKIIAEDGMFVIDLVMHNIMNDKN